MYNKNDIIKNLIEGRNDVAASGVSFMIADIIDDNQACFETEYETEWRLFQDPVLGPELRSLMRWSHLAYKRRREEVTE